MTSHLQNVWDNRQTILRRHSTEEKSEPIPLDFIFEIFLRSPVKCIARCRCVSKLWSSILRRPNFTDLYLKKSSTRPKLLLACQKKSDLIFFSAPDQSSSSSSSVATTSYHTRFPLDSRFDIITPINGFFLLRDKQVLKGKRNPEMVSSICNPSTGQFLTLPKPKTRKKLWISSYFGYDPIEKQYKVLLMTWGEDWISKEHQVLTLGSKKPSWRMIECVIPHIPKYDAICINGVLYYLAYMGKYYMIICFHVRSEKFSVIKLFDTLVNSGVVMINYNGKLASFMSHEHCYESGKDSRFFHCIYGTNRFIVLWVLEDLKKQEWSKHVYELPDPLWKNVIGDHSLLFVGVIGTNEIVLSPRYPSHPFYVFYYNVERRSIRRVEIQGAFKDLRIDHDCHACIFLDHVEELKFMQPF